MQAVVDKTIETFGRINVLIYNAQASVSGIPLAMTSQLKKFNESYPEAYENNLKAVPMGCITGKCRFNGWRNVD